MKKYRNFSDEFKREIIAEIDSKQTTIAQASREHNISSSLIERWRTQIHEGSLISRTTKREKLLEKELEQYKIKVAELTIANDLLKKTTNLMRVKKLDGYIVTSQQSDQKERPVK